MCYPVFIFKSGRSVIQSNETDSPTVIGNKIRLPELGSKIEGISPIKR